MFKMSTGVTTMQEHPAASCGPKQIPASSRSALAWPGQPREEKRRELR